ncbi:MAG: hypothetical protein PHI59_08550 [Candidatus Omnitrophica bacterium]|nr:hypothetical protein [Candidatus Omnitrophota bacterium]
MNTDLKNIINRELNIHILKEIYIFSNTPMYLYKNFRKDLGIQLLANKYSFADLIDFFENTILKERLELDEIVCIYAIIIALTYIEYYKTAFFFEKLDTYNFKWAKELKYIIMSFAKSTEIIKKKIEPRITIKEEPA